MLVRVGQRIVAEQLNKAIGSTVIIRIVGGAAERLRRAAAAPGDRGRLADRQYDSPTRRWCSLLGSMLLCEKGRGQASGIAHMHAHMHSSLRGLALAVTRKL